VLIVRFNFQKKINLLSNINYQQQRLSRQQTYSANTSSGIYKVSFSSFNMNLACYKNERLIADCVTRTCRSVESLTVIYDHIH
jgi:hypothetical protein